MSPARALKGDADVCEGHGIVNHPVVVGVELGLVVVHGGPGDGERCAVVVLRCRSEYRGV